MQGPKFKLFLRPNATQYYTVTGVGATATVGTTPTPTEGKHLPKGWEEIELATGRNTESWGLITQITSTFNFTKDSAKILRYVHALQGIGGKCLVEVWKQRSKDWEYNLYYTGQCDFNTFVDEGKTVAINIEQTGVSPLLYRDKDKVFEVAVTQADTRPVIMDGVALRNRTMTRMIGDNYQFNFGTSTFRPEVIIVNSESSIAVLVQDDPIFKAGSVSDTEAATFFTAIIQTTVEVVWDARIVTNISSSTGQRYGVWLTIRRAGATLTRYLLFEATGSTLTYEGTGVLNVPLQVGDSISVFGSVIVNTGSGDTPSNNNANARWERGIFTYTYNTRQQPTALNAERLGSFIPKLAAAVTGGVATVAPNVFTDPGAVLRDCYPYNLCIASSEALRGITNNTKIKQGWKDIEQAIKPFGCGVSIIGNEIQIKRLGEFFNDTPILGGDLGEVEVQISPALPYLFSTLKIGAKAGENDALQGRYEINAPQEWRISTITEISKSGNTRDIASPFITGDYAIEQIRSERIKDSTNIADDNRVVLVETEATATPITLPVPFNFFVPTGNYFKLYRPQNDGGNYVSLLALNDVSLQATAFNLTLSPARDLVRNEAMIAVQRRPDLNYYVQFTSAEREGTMWSKLGAGNPIGERAFFALYPLFALNAPFLPFFATFQTAEPLGLYAAMQANPHGYLTFTARGKTFKGYIHEIKRKPALDSAGRTKAEYQLLLHPTTDLSSLY